MHCDGGDGATIKQHLDSVYHRAKNNCCESIELLQNIALGKGEIATLTQDYLCRIVCQDEDGAANVAKKARAQCQSLITDFPQWINNTFLQDRFALLFIAGTHLKDEEPCTDNIPALVKEKIMDLDSLPVKPKWYTPEQGTFDAVDYATFNDNNRQLRYMLPQDGACQFRAALMLRDRNENWLDVDKSVILQEIKIASQMPVLGILTLAMAVTMLCGGINLSIISTANACSLVMAWVAVSYPPSLPRWWRALGRQR